MALGVMVLDVQEIRRIFKRRDSPVQIPHPLVNRGISRADILDIALEMLDVYGVKSDYRHE